MLMYAAQAATADVTHHELLDVLYHKHVQAPTPDASAAACQTVSC